MDFWQILYVIDWVLFGMMALTALYMLVFTITSLFFHQHDIPKTRNQNRFIIFDVTVISDHNDEMTNIRLAQEPVTLLTPNFKESTKAKALQLAINNLPQFKIYDVAIILDAGNLVETEFLDMMNEAFESAGTKAIQAHRLSRNRDTTTSRMGAVFEEINNSIFRRGHIVMGLSAALMGSGCAFEFNWFKNHISQIRSRWEDKELESFLMREHIYIDYFDQIYVFDEKTREAKEFNQQRGNWILAQYITLLRNIKYLPLALANRHYNWIDKIIQWMLVPRMVMMAVIIAMSIIIPVIYTSLAFKWWALFAVVLLVFALATPDYLVDEHWDGTFFKSPLVLMKSIPGLSKFAEYVERKELEREKKKKRK